MRSLPELAPVLTATLCLAFAVLLARRWQQRRRAHQLVWGLGLLAYGLAAGAEFAVLVVGGWTEPLYRVWYVCGALLVAAYLGAGEVYLLRDTRFGYLAAGGLVLGALPALVRGLFGDGAASGGALSAAALAIGGGALLAALSIALVQRLHPARVGDVTFAWLLVGTLLGGGAVLTAPVDLSAAVDPATGVVHGRGFPEQIRLATPVFNIAGALVLVLGAAYSGWMAWRRRTAPHRAVGSALVALGGFVPSLTSSLSRFGLTGVFHVGELLGVVCILAGFLVIERAAAYAARVPRGERPDGLTPSAASAGG